MTMRIFAALSLSVVGTFGEAVPSGICVGSDEDVNLLQIDRVPNDRLIYASSMRNKEDEYKSGKLGLLGQPEEPLAETPAETEADAPAEEAPAEVVVSAEEPIDADAPVAEAEVEVPADAEPEEANIEADDAQVGRPAEAEVPVEEVQEVQEIEQSEAVVPAEQPAQEQAPDAPYNYDSFDGGFVLNDNYDMDEFEARIAEEANGPPAYDLPRQPGVAAAEVEAPAEVDESVEVAGLADTEEEADDSVEAEPSAHHAPADAEASAHPAESHHHGHEHSGDDWSELSPRQRRERLRNERHAEVAHEQHEQMEERYERSSVANAIAIMLLGMLSFQISLFYMVNYPDVKIQQFTWTCLSTTISIFCALPTWTAIKALLVGITVRLTGESYDPEGVPENVVDILLPLSEFMCTFCFVHVLLLNSRHRKSWFSALSTIGAHVIGFAAIDGFGSLQQAHPWRNSCFMSLCATVISIVPIAMLCHWVTSIFQKMVAPDDEEDKEWLEECSQCGNEFAGFVIGQLVSQNVRYAIDGSLEPIEGFPWGKSWAQNGVLFGASILFAALLFSYTVVAQQLKQSIRRGEAVLLNARFIKMFEEALAMSFGWCLLMAGRWLYWRSTNDRGVGQGTVMTGRMLQALGFSFFVFVSIFVVDFVAYRGFGTSPEDSHALRQLIRAFGMVLGLSWEGAFREATMALGRNFVERPRAMVAMQEGLGLVICVIVLPAWGMYVLPVVRMYQQKAKAKAKADI